jgi:hypothetical protein
MKARGLSYKDYANMSRSDLGVKAAHQWFDMAGYKDLWAQRLGTSSSSSTSSSTGSSTGSTSAGEAPRGSFISGSYEAPPEERLLSQWERHTKHCATCQQVSLGSFMVRLEVAIEACIWSCYVLCCPCSSQVLSAWERGLQPAPGVKDVGFEMSWPVCTF